MVQRLLLIAGQQAVEQDGHEGSRHDAALTADELDELMDRYQNVMDQFQAIDGDFYESNIRKKLKKTNKKSCLLFSREVP